jgi:cyclophilin family peptidyl-prolyl cis-trans isomerase
MGDIEISFYTKDAPNTVENFQKLTKEEFYKNMLWHRVINGFVIQSGDPKGDGTGGPGYQFNDEINSRQFTEGVLGMANAGANTNGSQFFIVNGPTAEQSLNGKYTAFAEVTKGMDVVQKISSVEVDENDKPIEPVYLISAELR